MSPKNIHNNDVNYDVISTNPRVSNILMLAEQYTFHSRDRHSSIFSGSLERDLIAWNYAETDTSTFPRKTIEITTKYLILCSSIDNMWRKTLKTPNKLWGPVVKEGFG